MSKKKRKQRNQKRRQHTETTNAAKARLETKKTAAAEPAKEETLTALPAAAEAAAAEVTGEAAPKKKKKLKFYEITPETDIRYKGFLSYRHFKLIAWLLIVLACGGSMLSLYASMTETTEQYESAIFALKIGKDFAVPLLLFAGFATVLNGRDNYKKIIIKNTAVALVLAVLFMVVYERYVVRGAEAILGEREYAEAWINSNLDSNTSNGFLAFNIFIDLTLCTLVLFFLNYNPKKYFQGKKIHFFRAMVLLPISYEIASICLKVLASTHAVTLPVYIFPFLTTKPPVAFLMFVLIAKYFKEMEFKFKKHGKTHEDYETYLTTNHNSFRFAKFVAVIIIIVAVIDALLLILIASLHIIDTGSIVDISDERMVEALNLAWEWGFGKTLDMILIIPVILLFSYTKTHKNKLIDILVPLAGVVLIILVCFDGIFTIICEAIKESFAAAAANGGM